MTRVYFDIGNQAWIYEDDDGVSAPLPFTPCATAQDIADHIGIPVDRIEDCRDEE